MSGQERTRPWEQPAVYFFAPPAGRESRDQEEIRRAIGRKCGTEDVELHVRRAELVRVAGGQTSGRSFNLVRTEDARELYSQIHRSPVIVFSSLGCFIRRDPSSNPVRKKQLLSLEGFVRYKAHFRVFRSPAECARFTEEVCSLSAAFPATSVHDPRILPLHVFDSEQEWRNLQDETGVREFKTLFGRGAVLLDRGRREWVKASDMHGGDVLRVCGIEIPRGYHWDVTRRKGGERITTTHEVWKLPGSNSYCNIYPDGYIRQGQGSGKNRSRKVWPS
ncbi:hypothetical protein ACLIYP_09400 [Streptomyces nanhaiensis]|uniref:hypothetical protein n=1 Tax=Streptomyces nanhaiensis TaxID=679319 RepID=UPI00399D4548